MTTAQPRISFRGWSLILVGVTFVLHLASSLYMRAIYANGYDLSIFDQAIRHYARFEAPISMSLEQDANTLGEHFSPIVALAAPLYWIWDDPRMLLALQSALVAVSVLVVLRFARRHVSDRLALVFGFGYALGWPLQGLTAFDFHEIAFAVPLLALAIDALDRRDDRALLLWGIALLTVREDMGLILITLGMVRALRTPRRWFGLVLVGIGVVAYVVVTAVIIPALSVTDTWRFWSYDALGTDLPSSVRTIVTDPVTAVRLFLTPEPKLTTLVLLFLPVVFVLFRSPYTLVLVPLLAARFWSSRENLWGVDFHYNSIVWVVVVLAAIHAVSLLPSTVNMSVARVVAGTMAVMAVFGTLLAPSAFKIGTWPRVAISDDSIQRDLNEQRTEMIAQIPAGTCAVGDTNALSHLLPTNVIGIPGRWSRPADFQLLDRANENPQVSDRAIDEALDDGYVEVASTERLVLLRSADYTGPTDGCRP